MVNVNIFRSVDPSIVHHSVKITEMDPKRSTFPKSPESEKREFKKFLVTNTKYTPFLDIYLTYFISASNAETFCYPLDVFKTRIQIKSEMVNKSGLPQKYREMLATLFGILKGEGFLTLYGGISTIVLRHSFFSGSKMLFYDFFRDQMIGKERNRKTKLTFVRGTFCGAMTGECANVIFLPTDLIKVQMQMEGKRRLMGEPPRIQNVFQALTSFYNTGGIMNLWKGTMPSTWRAALITLGDISVYDLSKRKLMIILNQPNNLIVQFLGAMIAGFAGAVVSTPADVVKSRIKKQPTDKAGRGLYYKGTLDCFSKLVKEEGLFAMYKGFLPYWQRVGPFAMLFWMTFEQIRRLWDD